MSRKLTITVSEDVYQGLHQTIGRGKISKFMETLARPYVVAKDIEAEYREMAADETREREAMEWSEALIGDAVGKPTLQELVDGITPENRHPAMKWGPPVGKEVW